VIQTSRSIMAIATTLLSGETVYLFCIAFFIIVSINAKIRFHFAGDKR
jgi:hypothetical protein